MSVEQKVSSHKRRTRAEVQELVEEFMSSGMRRSEFCRSRRLSFGTDRHLKKQRWKRKGSRAFSRRRLVPVELAARKSPPTQHEPSCGLAVVLSGGRRIEVQGDFDTATFERLMSALERV